LMVAIEENCCLYIFFCCFHFNPNLYGVFYYLRQSFICYQLLQYLHFLQPLHTANIYGKAAATAATATKAKWNEITRTSSIFVVYFSSDSSPFLLENMHEFTSLCFSVVVYSVYNVYNCFGFWYRSPNAYLPDSSFF